MVGRVLCETDHRQDIMYDKNAHLRVAVAVFAFCAALTAALAADGVPADKPRVVVLCPECGMVYNVRRIEKPVAPERNLLPSVGSSSHAGGTGNETRAVPLFSIGASGAQRVQRDPVMRNVWEITVRYDNGQFGFVTNESEPDLKVGDRVRHVEHTLELLAPPER
jgi:hypothetical protein